METAPERTGFDAGRLTGIDDHINRNYIEPGKITGCQILVSRQGIPAYHRCFGDMDKERGKPTSEETIYRIYSMSKPITSVALMQLYEKGLFQLNDPVSRVFPSWKSHQVYVSGQGDDMVTKAPNRPVTFRHMLTHSGGITYGGTNHPVDQAYKEKKVNRRKGETLMSFMENLSQVPLRYEPGERWMYSLSTDVCGALVEQLSGMPFADYLEQNIFGPLKMQDTAFYVDADKADRFSANYQRNPDKTLKLIDDPATSNYLTQPSFSSGGGGLTSTMGDYYRFCEMLRRGGELDGERILGPRTIDLMRTNHLPGNQDLTRMAIGSFSETANEGVGFGLGFAQTLGQVEAGGYGDGDYYWGGAASTIFWVDPVEDLVVIFMTQLMPSGTFNFRGQLKNIIYSAMTD